MDQGKAHREPNRRPDHHKKQVFPQFHRHHFLEYLPPFEFIVLEPILHQLRVIQIRHRHHNPGHKARQ